MDSSLNKIEFYLGILTGYWARHVNDNAVYPGTTINMKMLRWSEDGSVDKICQKINSS